MIFSLLFGGKPAHAANAYDFAFVSIDGKPMPLAEFRGRALLIVNTASLCGFTPQYKGLQAVWQRFRQRGLVVIGVPSNDFGDQEPGSESDIKTFCEVNFDIDFPLTRKEHVVGDNAHPFYKWAAQELGFVARPHWNFHKYLIAPDGRLVDWFSTVTAPESERMTQRIEEVLPAHPPETLPEAVSDTSRPSAHAAAAEVSPSAGDAAR